MTRTNQLLLLLVVLTASVSAFWFVALTPKREEAAQLQEQIVAKQAELDTARGQVASYEQARAAYPRNYAAVARLGKAVPADDDVRSLVVQLDAAAKRSKVDFEVINVGANAAGGAAGTPDPNLQAEAVIPGATLNAASFSTLPMSFAFRGSYFELSSLFTRLERFVTVSNRRIDVTGRLLLLQSISLVPDTEGFPQMRAQINATSYLVTAAPDVTAAATPDQPGAVDPTADGQSAGAGAPGPATATGVLR
jgi:Tfp pilus assembly protein PilO